MSDTDSRRAPSDAPLLSICIPTYNRAACLDRVLTCLADVVSRYGDLVQVCVSDNHSSDQTSAVIARWRTRFTFDAIAQTTNIGATRNVAQVVARARGQWVLVMGDDDLIDLGSLEGLLLRLRSARKNDWILAGVGAPCGQESILHDTPAGLYRADEARALLRRLGLQRMGFIGMHVFPSALCQALQSLPAAASQPWPHVALLLRHIATSGVLVCPSPLVQQAGAGRALFWRQGDWMRLLLRMVDILAAARDDVGPLGGFYESMMLRQLYDGDALKGMIYWRFFEPDDFSRSALRAFVPRYRLLGWRVPLAIGHAVLLAVAWCIPARAFRWFEYARGRGDSLGRYREERERYGAFDGMQRGL